MKEKGNFALGGGASFISPVLVPDPLVFGLFRADYFTSLFKDELVGFLHLTIAEDILTTFGEKYDK